ncbi:Cytoskeleton-associated protein 5-like [Homarus americanus]|uniref:Cytoskeleton-associated protein 5-like n=1 Tax=Homarus americanus TaxID=6706 RepID=A0A8J5J9C0_HOMAM|nr:Cytoskeleton-associated protein 5-like [Homarus americanus]
MEEDTEYLKLPLEDRCVHKLWKARLNGYEECTKYFPKITDERSPEFNKFAPLMKKFVTDSNAVAQEKALDAVLAFVENAHVASRTAGDCTSGVVQKCLAAPKRGTQEKALEIILMYCEIEKYEIVQEELMKGFSQKNPKVVAGCVRALTTALREFGPKVISPKPLMKQVHTLLEDRDKNVREEGKKLVIEMYRWIRQALKPQMSSLKPVQVQELEAEFEKLGGEKVVQTRFLRSQQELKAKIEAQADGDDDEDEEEEEETPQIDPFDLMDPVEAKKWQERKEAVELLHPLTQNIKLEAGDYHDLMKVLKKMIAKDTNVMIVAQAGHCVAGLARGLKKKFSPFAQLFTETILEKFKEKKVNVVSAMREAIDAVYQTTTLEAIQEIVSTALTNKNPQVKAETTAFLARSLCYCTPAILNKKMLKVITADLLRGLNESDPTVRDNSCEALGVALRVVGEKQMMVSIADVDNLKMQKIREASEKAEIKVKISAPKAKKAAPSKREAHVAEAAASGPRKVVRGGATAGRGSKGGGGGGGGGRGPPVEECKEAEISIEEALEKATEVLPEDVVNGLTDSNWKARLTAVESFTETVRMMDCSEIPTQALVRVLAQKPGFKDNNFQVLKLRLEALKHLAENSDFTRRSGEVCIQDLVEKLGDPKNGPLCGEVLLAMAEAAKLQWVGPEVMTRAFEQKSPKVQEVALKWLSDAITEFGFVLQPKALISDIKKALGHTNPGVRTAGVSLCGTIYLYMGATLRVFFEDEKAALLQQIDTEFERLNGTSPPAATRGINRDGSTDNDGEDDDVDSGQAVINVQDLVPRTNVRNEALVKVSNIISEAKFIKGDISELPTVLAARMNDMNKNLALEALRITASLAVALGPHCKPHTRNIVPGMLAALGDSKQNIRQQAMSTLNSWVEQAGVKETIDGEVFADALKSGSPFLKAELFLWMAEKLKDAPTKGINKEELHACTQYLFMALEDRNADVRKGANEAVMPFMIHLGYEGMLKHTSRVKPSSKNTVMQALEKAKPNLPAKPQPKQKVSTSGGGPPTRGGAQGGGGACSGGKGTPTGKKTLRAPSATRMGSAAGRKDSEDVDTSPLLQVNNLKQQRASDEQRLRVLRWDFSTPRAEFITQLKDQMTTAGMNRQLVSNMFHQDFKFHIKAIDALNEDLTSNLPACIANLDLILKWLTIRFFDTNPSVIIKAMDYLQQVFQLVSEDEYHLLDTEANGFLPFLVTKFGDPKDSIRGPARNIAKLICNIYPASKVSPYMLEGLKAKNARQRAECLEAIGNLIEVYGMPVCQPSPGVALKEIAKQIADRDNSVRNAALNGLVQVYFREGEKVFKLVGNVRFTYFMNKDMSLLEERIKRAAKNRPVIKKPPVEPEVPTVRGGGAASGRLNRVIPTPAQPAPAIVRDRESSAGGDQSSLIKRLRNQHQSTNPATPFKIDYGLIEKLLENDNTDRPQYNIEEIPDMASILNYKPVCPTPASKLTRPGFSSVPRPLSSASPIESEGAAHAINMVISQVGTPDANTVITALSQLDEVLQSEERCYELAPHIDQLLIVATLQYRLVLNTKMANPNVNKEECIKIYRSLTNCLMMIFNNKQLGTKATRDVLRDVVHVLIHILLDPRLTQLEDGPQIIRAINVLVVRIVEKAQFTHVFSALLKLLHESVSSGGGCKFTELVMKCNWKVIRILPSRTNDLDLDQILFDVHNFLVAYPVNTWSERPSDTPLRTIKTVIHTLCKVYGTTILSHFSKIDNAHGSELHKYLTKALKKPKTEDDGGIGDSNRLAAAQVSNDSAESGKSPKRLSKTAHNTLSEIFRKIGSKENTKENYIERGLKRVEMERQAEVKMTSNPASESGSNSGPLASIQVPDTTNFNMNDLVDQFKSIAARAGFDNTYIDTAVKDICSTEKEAKGDISEYIKGLPSEYNVEQTMDRYGSHDQ